MSDNVLQFEFKEVWWPETKPPARPKNIPDQVHFVVGIVYDVPKPKLDDKKRQRPDWHYDIAAYHASYYYMDWRKKRRSQGWILLGYPYDFLSFLTGITGHAASWPKPFERVREFCHPNDFDIHPYRELLRRHYQPGRYITDIDMVIDLDFENKIWMQDPPDPVEPMICK